MKTTLLMTLALATPLHAATESDAWERAFDFPAGSAPRLFVRNVWGEVRVRGHDGDQIQVRVRETRKAADAETLARVTDSMWLETLELADGVELTVESPDRERRGRDRCRRCELHLDFEILVPFDARVDVATVMDGAVQVEGVRGPVRAHNVNGDVEAGGVQQCAGFETVNGELRVRFERAPAEDCAFETVNGDMTVDLPAGSDADVTLDLFNGRVRSDFEVTPLVTEPRVEKATAGRGTHYRVSQDMGLRLGAGGPRLHFESINGDVLLRRAR